MRILHLRSSGGFFGAERVIASLVKNLSKQGMRSTIACICNKQNPHTELTEFLKRQGFDTLNIDCRGILDWSSVRHIRTILCEQKVDIIHCHDYKANMYGYIASRGLKVKKVTTNHLWTSDTLALRIYEFLDGLLMNGFNKIVAVSDDIAQSVKKFCISREKVETIHNGIDLESYREEPDQRKQEDLRFKLGIQKDDYVIGAVGRLTPQKGYEYLLQAMRSIIELIPQARLLIVGDGYLKQSLKSQSISLGIDSRVVFAGVQSDMPAIYRLMDIFAISSIDEGFPMVLLEALAMRRVVIATQVGAIDKVIENGLNGFIVPARNPFALTDKIIKLKNDKNLATKVAEKGYQIVEQRFSSDTTAIKYKLLYNKLMEES